MQLLKTEKQIQLNVKFRNLNQLSKALKRAYELGRLGIQEHKEQDDEFKLEFSFVPEFNEKVAEARIEEINGEKCMIIPSKMNENWKIN